MNRMAAWAFVSIACVAGACTGSDGKDAAPCTVSSTDAGAVVTCPDNTTATVTGATGATGPTGEAGISCRVTTLPSGGAAVVCTDGSVFSLTNAAGSLDGSTCTTGYVVGSSDVLVRCPDGTSALIHNGTDGTKGATGTNGANCVIQSVDGGVASRNAGTYKIYCSDESWAIITSGTDGKDGKDGVDGKDGQDAAFKVLLLNAPLDGTTSEDAAFFFDCTASSCDFTCALDSETAAPCSSPFVRHDLTAGQSHSLSITAVPSADAGVTLVDGGLPTARATYAWTIAVPPTVDAGDEAAIDDAGDDAADGL